MGENAIEESVSGLPLPSLGLTWNRRVNVPPAILKKIQGFTRQQILLSGDHEHVSAKLLKVTNSSALVKKLRPSSSVGGSVHPSADAAFPFTKNENGRGEHRPRGESTF